MDTYQFKISVVMAVYKVEEFLRESIESLVRQSIGFENIQLILVEDGSPDGSGAICDEYAEKYPDNVEVIHKENGGVSSARNAGLARVKGELVNFLDSDDKLIPNTCQRVYDFYCQNRQRTDVVTIPLRFFDGATGEHTLNYKFKKGNRVIDLDKEWNACQLSTSSCFIRAECLKELRFDPRLSYAEDANLLQRVLVHKCTLGVVSNAAYMYRRRSTGAESAIQSAVQSQGWYLPYMKYFQEETIRFYWEKTGGLPRFIQYVLMYDLQWRLRLDQIPAGVLSEEETDELFDSLCRVLRQIDDEVILAQRNLFSEFKVFALRMKYGRYTLHLRDNDAVMMCGNMVAAKLSDCSCRLEFLHIKDGFALLEGRFCVYDGMHEDLRFAVCANDEVYEGELTEPDSETYSLGRPILHLYEFRVKIPLTDDLATVDVVVQVMKNDCVVPLKKWQFGTFFPVSNQRYKHAYAVRNGWKIGFVNNSLRLQTVTAKETKRLEKAYRKELWQRNGLGERKAVLLRMLSTFLAKRKKKPLWLIGDRDDRAGDNGEAFFRYVRENHPEIDARFVIGKNCPDYRRMAQIGPVLAKGSHWYKALLLISDYVISSQGESDVFNPFLGYSECHRDELTKTRFVFLQHGVIHTDLSEWLSRYSKNIYGFVTSAKPEAESILAYRYHYSPDRVWLTGLPRFDRLYRAEEKQITIMPTWRKYLLKAVHGGEKGWGLGNSFAGSEYLSFYNDLLNHPRLLEAARVHGYTIAFFPHPNLQHHLNAFQKNDQVVFLSPDTAYRDVYAKSNLIVSDYSSAVFDFAYLRKPIIYSQFDKEEFFSGNHTVGMGYFDYERDGFGEVEYTLEDTVDRIIEYMENGCELKSEYRDRIDRFFAFDDQNNCQRLYDKILASERLIDAESEIADKSL